MRNSKPAWWLLYALPPLVLMLLVAAHRWLPDDGRRTFVEVVISLMILGVIDLWVRANRVALACLSNPSQAEQSLRTWVAYCPPPAQRKLDLLEPEPIQDQTARTEHLEKEYVTCFVK